MWDEERESLESIQDKVNQITNFFWCNTGAKTIIELVLADDVKENDELYDVTTGKKKLVIAVEKATNIVFIEFEDSTWDCNKDSLVPQISTVYVMTAAPHF